MSDDEGDRDAPPEEEGSGEGRWPEHDAVDATPSRLEEIFERALGMPASARPGFVATACGGDRALEAEVLALLAADASESGPLDTPLSRIFAPLLAFQAAQPPEPADAKSEASAREGDHGHDSSLGPGRHVGPYAIVREIGRGGMGTVHLAERADGAFEQRVALKVVNAGILTAELEQRFLRERQILARLDHPGIARLLHGGLTPQGHPYLAMQLVEGDPITVWAEARALDVEARLRLFLDVCDAVQYAHRQLVVHRDLKPSNIVVSPDGSTCLLDFGIARLLSADGDDEASTRTGLLLLTPEYAAPEQLRGEAATASTDVYALGVVLYELLAGQPPFDVGSGSWSDVVRRTEQDPPVPSRARGLERGVRRQLAGDLDAVVHMALRNDPDRRYSSVEAFADDVRRFLGRRPVRARPDAWSYRSARFLRRHAVATAAALLVALSLVAGLAGTAWQARAAAREATKASEISAFLTSLFELSDPDVSNGERVTARELLDQGARRVDAELSDQPEVQAELLALLGEIHHKLGLYDRADSLLARALALRRDLFGSAHADVAAVLTSLGALRSDQGRGAEAERLLRDALAVREARLGVRHTDVALSLRELASVLSTRGALTEAESLLHRGIAIDSQAYGAVHAEVARDLEILSNVLHAKSDHVGAIDAARRTLEIRREVLGEEHLETATAKNNLALYVSRVGELDEAERLYRDVLAFDIDRLGEEHPYTATVTNNLASVLRRKGDLDQAEVLYRQVLALDIRLFGEVHHYVATVMNNLAVVQRERGEMAEAETLFRDALEMFRDIFGDDHYSVGTAYAHLAETLRRRGAYAEAEPLFLEALARLTTAFPDGHVRTASALLGRGRLLTETGRASDGEPLLREAVAIRESMLGATEALTIDAQRALGDCLTAQGRFGEAEPILLAAWRAIDGKRYVEKERREMAASLVALYERWGRPADAGPYQVISVGT